MSLLFSRPAWATFVVAFGVIAASHGAEPKLLKVPAEDWKIDVVPGRAIGPSPVPKVDRAVREAQLAKAETSSDSKPTTSIVPASAESAMPAGITSASYLEVYNSIPFRRSEYSANPNYRHEATIELLLGQIRPKTVTNVMLPAATCCVPATATFVPWFRPWGKSFYYHDLHTHPSGYWVR